MSWWSFKWRLWNASGLSPIQHQLSGGSAWLQLSGSCSLSDRCLSLGRMTGLEMGDVWMPLWNCTYGRRAEKHGQGAAERDREREREKERGKMRKEVVLSSRFNDSTIWLWCRQHLTEMESPDIMELFLLQTQNEQLTSIKYINLAMYQLYFKWNFGEIMQKKTFYACIQITKRLDTFVKCEKLKNFVFLVIFLKIML